MSLYTKKIPNNYQVCMVIDVYEKGVAYLFKIIAYIILFIICGLMLYLKKPEFNFEDTKEQVL